MTLFYYDPIFLNHDTGGHPESAQRIVQAVERLNTRATDPRCRLMPCPTVLEDHLLRVHNKAYCQSLRTDAHRGGGHVEQDTVICPQSVDVALVAAGTVCDAVRQVVQGTDTTAFCLVRPPGHHALPNAAMGFCLFNNVAVAARMATHELDLERVLIVDWDVHHGNGTQAMFWEDPKVSYFSIHRWPFYPGTGDADERGSGQGLGSTLNLPVAFGTSRRTYLARFAVELEHFADRVRPQLIMISAGFDAHREDPVGSLGLETEDFAPLTYAVMNIAKTHAEGRVVSVLEGGYHPAVVAECVDIHLDAMLNASG